MKNNESTSVKHVRLLPRKVDQIEGFFQRCFYGALIGFKCM